MEEVTQSDLGRRAKEERNSFSRLGATLGVGVGLALVVVAVRSVVPGATLQAVGTPIIYLVALHRKK